MVYTDKHKHIELGYVGGRRRYKPLSRSPLSACNSRRVIYFCGSIPRLLCSGCDAKILFCTKWYEMHVLLGKLEECVMHCVLIGDESRSQHRTANEVTGDVHLNSDESMCDVITGDIAFDLV